MGGGADVRPWCLGLDCRFGGDVARRSWPIVMITGAGWWETVGVTVEPPWACMLAAATMACVIVVGPRRLL